mmetsp:Transcript_3925/g.4262  ORF Transcript_3925/g.4262 Transcript_3925/m.4262 type:complete len:392 (-) Transcript_3925:451-1626(-)
MSTNADIDVDDAEAEMAAIEAEIAEAEAAAQEAAEEAQRKTAKMKSLQDKMNAAKLSTTAVSKPKIAPSALAALQALLIASPRIRAKLRPSPPANHSGMLGDFSFPGFDAPEQKSQDPPPPPPPTFPETDPQFWKQIATFDPSGHISTLSLSANRLHDLCVKNVFSPSLLETARVLDLANTDLTAEDIAGILSHCSPTKLQQLHLGGNALGDEGMRVLAQGVLPRLSLDMVALRYNDIGPGGAAVLSELILGGCSWNILYMEGNPLEDEGAKAMAKSLANLKEVYLGQTKIGIEGAKSLASEVLSSESRLQKLFLEGNDLQDEGARAFWELLETKDPSKRKLERLYVDNNGIHKDNMLRLGKALNSITMVGVGLEYQQTTGDEDGITGRNQ